MDGRREGREDKNMYPLLTTRFNETTWSENTAYRTKKGVACIYSLRQAISEKIPLGEDVIVIEMNNSANRVEGFGLMRNMPESTRRKIYEDRNYNRFCYRGKHYVDRETAIQENPVLVETLDTILFRGKSHMKRGIGMTSLTQKILNRHHLLLPHIEQDIRGLFMVAMRRADAEKPSEKSIPVLQEQNNDNDH
jgi:hypothetical protein